METYVFNPAYLMINDKKRIIVTESLFVDKDPLAKNGFTSVVHPVCAMFVAMFDGEHSLEDTIRKASINLDMGEDLLLSVAKKMIESTEKPSSIEFGGSRSEFPQRTLIKKEEAQKLFGFQRNYKIRDFFIPHDSVDLKTIRFYKPLEMSFVINLKCATDCIYCYANKKGKYTPLATDRILSIIDEAKNLNMRNFDLSGGELFMHKDWAIILERIVKNGFIPYVSTKVPIDEETIIKYKAIGMKKLQVSIDSFNPEVLTKLLRTSADYVERITKTFDLLEKHGIEVITHTILTNYNSSFQDIMQLVRKLNSYFNISSTRFDFVGYSIYIDPATNEKNMLSQEEGKHLFAKIEALKADFPKITIGDMATKETSFRYTEEKFNARARCSGNMYRFTMLPDGKVTYCEELYWHEQFIMGDLSFQSIEEMWNSDTAKERFYRKQECYQKASPCSTCSLSRKSGCLLEGSYRLLWGG